MRITAILVLASLLLLGACSEKDTASPRPPLGQEDLIGQEFHFKVSSKEWEENGRFGTDLQGYLVNKQVPLLTQGLVQNGTVRVYVKRGNSNWAEMPFYAHEGGPMGMNWRFSYWPGFVQVQIDRNGTTFDPPDQLMMFRVVVFGG